MARVQKTVFISYRRKDIAWALNVYRYLTNRGYDVFFDYTSIPSGDFEQIIISNIKARAHFLVILTPTAPDRCSEPGDWLRREIETAIQEKRNIIPLFFDGFSFGSPSISEKLTGQLATLKQYNGLDVYAGYFDAAMERLCKQYLNIALDAVLHPISAEVQQVVKEQQVAADQAALQRDQAEEKGGKNTSAQRLSVIQDVVGEKTKQKQPHKFDSRRWGTRGGILLMLFCIVFGIYYLINNWPFKAIPASTDTLTPSHTPTRFITTATPFYTLTLPHTPIPTKTPLPTATFAPTIIPTSTVWTRPADGMVMVYVPESEFKMGSNILDDERPIHIVYLDAFWIDQTEVTNKMYALCVAAGQCDLPDSNRSNTRLNYYGNPNYDNFPVLYVSWNDADAYCKWAGNGNYIIRLPTEAEWEKSASWDANVQEKHTYPWGNTINCTYANYWGNGDGCVGDTTKGGNYPLGASSYGVLDMAGNVWEWIADWYSGSYYSTLQDGARNPTGPSASDGRVIRGGAWNNYDNGVRSAYRDKSGPTYSSNVIGFRCSRTP